MKALYLIGGTMGVGELQRRGVALENYVMEKCPAAEDLRTL